MNVTPLYDYKIVGNIPADQAIRLNPGLGPAMIFGEPWPDHGKTSQQLADEGYVGLYRVHRRSRHFPHPPTA